MTRAWVEIDLGALCRNGAAVAARAGVPLLPMVKADGYGLGGLRAALALESLQPWGYGVATVTEGDELRRGGITRPIVVFTPILRNEIDALRRGDLTPALGDPAVIESWARTGRPWHLQVDTGMSRAGMRWDLVRRASRAAGQGAPGGSVHPLSFGRAGRREPRSPGEALFGGACDAAGASRPRARGEWSGRRAPRAVEMVDLPTGNLSLRRPRLRGGRDRAGACGEHARPHRRGAHRRRR